MHEYHGCKYVIIPGIIQLVNDVFLFSKSIINLNLIMNYSIYISYLNLNKTKKIFFTFLYNTII